jgi:putative membrane protein
MTVDSLFSASDLTRIRQAVAQAEHCATGEIVPYLVARIDDYPVARWRAATLGALTLALIAAATHHFSGLWGIPGVLWIAFPALLGAGLGYALTARPGIARRFITDADIERRVQLRAEAAFLEEEVFATARRTGILLFVAVYEQRALVLADTGIHRQVPDGTWQTLIDDLIGAIRAGRAAAGLCNAIARCGEVLETQRTDCGAVEVNELHDALRIRQR